MSLIEQVVSVAPEMGYNDLTVEQMAAALASGTTVIESFAHGFAVVNVAGSHQDDPGAFLRMLYVTPEYRGQGIGSVMLKSVRAKHAPEYCMRLLCVGKQRAKWFSSRGFKVIETEGEVQLMVEKPAVSKNQAKYMADRLYAICRRLEDYAHRYPNDELQDLADELRGFAMAQTISTVGQVSRTQTAKAKQHRNAVTNEELIAFRDAYPKSKNGLPKKGWIGHAVRRFEKLKKPISRDTIAARMKAIAE